MPGLTVCTRALNDSVCLCRGLRHIHSKHHAGMAQWVSGFCPLAFLGDPYDSMVRSAHVDGNYCSDCTPPALHICLGAILHPNWPPNFIILFSASFVLGFVVGPFSGCQTTGQGTWNLPSPSVPTYYTVYNLGPLGPLTIARTTP
ncbi:hypothetical protein PCANC_28546 [Puccinia coronata f. sp. avenae]|uniref:Uncharacterized protein n=1 Tax=Puccinia coronata f. sp. avenae TaxID=200324 RepID=A0A2N5T9A1_9BASI|nr:hypothetical protein PCANC_28546 [Puccinia coronata f. sp. avenae]